MLVSRCFMILLAHLRTFYGRDAPYFTAFGDWGHPGGNFHRGAAELRSRASVHGSSRFTLLLGDNFYSHGVASLEDRKFGLFSEISPTSDVFFAVAGNHDYDTPGSVDHQIAYSAIDPKWIFPSPYHSRVETIAGVDDLYICLLFIDSMTFIEDLQQQQWLDRELSACHQFSTLRIVSGHFPVYSAGMYAQSKRIDKYRATINPILIKHKVHVYLSGHEHQLQAFVTDGVHYLVSGAITSVNRAVNERFKNIMTFQHTSYGFVDFSFDIPGGMVHYNFISAADRRVLHSSSIKFAHTNADRKEVDENIPETSTKFTVTLHTSVLITIVYFILQL